MEPGTYIYVDRNAPSSGEFHLQIGAKHDAIAQLEDQTGRQHVEVKFDDGVLVAVFRDTGEGCATVPVADMDGRFESVRYSGR